MKRSEPNGPSVQELDRRRLRRVYVQVFTVQILALVSLWLLQSCYGRG